MQGYIGVYVTLGLVFIGWAFTAGVIWQRLTAINEGIREMRVDLRDGTILFRDHEIRLARIEEHCRLQHPTHHIENAQ